MRFFFSLLGKERNCMKRFPSIKKNTEFSTVYKKGRSLSCDLLVMYILENGLDENRLGISVSKRVGNSVVRHGISRKMREIFRLNNANLKTGFDIVTVIRMPAKDAEYRRLNDAYMRLAGRHNLIAESDEKNQESK